MKDKGVENRVKEIFEEAENLYKEAMEEFKKDKLRDSAEKVLRPNLRVTNALTK